MTKQLKIELQAKLKPIFATKARYRVAYGGRGSGKSWAFARMLLLRALEKKIRILCARELQNSIKDSVHKLLADQIQMMGLNDFYDIGASFIRCKNGSEFIFKGLRSNAQEIKSMENIAIAWIEEAQAISADSWQILAPTIRGEDSEIWVTFNPNEEEDIVYKMFVKNQYPNSLVTKINWSDNTWFPKVLEEERTNLLAADADAYQWVYEGFCRKFAGGAIYGKEIALAEKENRICKVPYNPSFPVITAWDIGYSDATAIWFCQIVGKEPRIIDYYENNIQALPHYADLIRSKPYSYEMHVLPHDAGHNSIRTGLTVVKQLENLGIGENNRTIKVLTRMEIASGIHLVRSLLNQLWIDEEKAAQGLKCLRRYHYAFDEKRGRFNEDPYHDWSSNGADAMRYLATYLASNRPNVIKKEVVEKRIVVGSSSNQSLGWMG